MSIKSVSVVLPILIEHAWQIPMTRCAIETLKCTTQRQFELVIVETKSSLFKGKEFCDVHVEKLEKTCATADCNAGIEAASGDLIVYSGNDVFVRDEWLEALLECFEIIDCGAATLASSDLKKNPIGQLFGQRRIMEGIYGPFMMFEKGWLFDSKEFPCQFADADLVMRIYESRKRMYRNCRVVIEHLNRQTLSGEENTEDFKRSRQKFMDRYSGSNLLIYRILSEGWII